MRVALTNDDGYDAPGLGALFEAVAMLGDVEIHVVAPVEVQSGKSQSLSSQIRYREIDTARMGRILTVDGTPADCVRLATYCHNRARPDWLIAGINQGGNLGVDVFYSGTVAAAREAAINGIPAVAVSQVVSPDDSEDWARSSREAAAVIAAICQPARPPPPAADATIHKQALRALQANPFPADATCCWNVNLPRLPADVGTGGVRVVPVASAATPLEFEQTTDPDGTIRLSYTTPYADRPAPPGTDIATVFGGSIAISPIRLACHA